MTNNSTFEILETSTYIGLHGCEICGREVLAMDVCSGCQQWVERYAEMLPVGGQMSVDLQ